MRKPPRAVVLSVMIPFVAGCMGTIPRPLPEPSARPEGSVRGVVLDEDHGGTRVEFSEVAHVEWSDSTVAITGVLKEAEDGPGEVVTRIHRLSELESLLVRQLDPNRTSILVASVVVGITVIGALLFTGKTNESTVF